MASGPQEPHSSEAESTVIGGCLVYPEDFPKAAVLLKAKDFYGVHAKLAWEAMTTIFERGQHADMVMVCDELGERAKNGPFRTWLGSTIDGIPRITNLEEWAGVIKEKSSRRSLVQRCLSTLKAAQDDCNSNDALFEMLATADSQIRGDSQVGVVHVSELIPEAMRRLEEYAAKEDGIMGIRTGLGCLDALTSGMREGQLILLGGRPGRGKSALSAQIARTAARDGKRVLIFPMEMSPRQVVERGLLSESATRRHDLRDYRSEYRDSAWAALVRQAGALAGLPMWFDRQESPTVGQMTMKAQTQKDRHGLDLIVVDYVQRMTLSAKTENRTVGVAENIQRLKSLARRLEVPVLAAYQLDTVDESQEQRPSAANLAQCKQVAESEADMIWFLHPVVPQSYKEDLVAEMELIVNKQRDGATGIRRIIFDKERTRMYEIPECDAQRCGVEGVA